ncbi:MAG TPA: acyltransferase, partial [Ktedonobacterales bacterium]
FAVSAFIAISGFSLMLPVARGDGRLPGGAWTFFKRRARRILPPYYFAIAFSLILIWLWLGHPSGTSWDASIPVSKTTLVVHALLLNDFWPSGYFLINGVFWSIALEWHLYFFFPALVLLARRFGALATCLTTLAAAYLLCEVLTFVPAHDLLLPAYLPGRITQFVEYLGLFALGMLAATVAFSAQPVWSAVRRRVPWGAVALMAFAGVVIMFAQTGPHQITSQVFLGADLLITVVTLSLFIAAGRAERSLARIVLGARPIAFTGKFAYSIYLIHAPIVAAVYLCIVRPHISGPLHLPFPATVAVMMVTAVPIAIAAAYLFFLVCERPFLNKPLGRQTKKPRGAPAAANATQAASAAPSA